MTISSIDDILHDLKQGRMVILVDEEDRENEGDLVCAAQCVTPAIINFMATHARGLICLTLTQEHCDRLGLAPMVNRNLSSHGTNFTASIEAASGVTTGISAADRAHTILTCVHPDVKPEDLVQPGHVFPLRAVKGGVLMRAGHTEAGCDLMQLAQMRPASVICEIMRDDGTMARLPDLIVFAEKHNLRIGTIADLIAYRSRNESLIEPVHEQTLHTAAGDFRCVAYRDLPSQGLHLLLTKGPIDSSQATLVRVHEPISMLDLLEQQTTQHSWGLLQSLEEISRHGSGVLVLLNAGESAPQLLERLQRLNDPPAQRAPGTSHDLRSYGIGAQILRDAGVRKMRLLGHPRRMPSMVGYGLEIVDFLETPQPAQPSRKPKLAVV